MLGVIKTYRLTYEAIEVLHAMFDERLAHNSWAMSALTLRMFTDHFGAGTEQLDIVSDSGRAIFTSYTEKIMDGNSECSRKPR